MKTRSYPIPELPEVETVKNGLLDILGKNAVIEKIVYLRKDLRESMPTKIKTLFKNKKILGISRRAKYLIINCGEYSLVSHLGMTGSWRELREGLSHDHIHIFLKDGRKFAYRDPRRFGIFDYMKTSEGENYHRFSHLGPEPLSEDFSFEYLWQKTRKRQTSVKSFIMDQKIVVGVGNIYAVESLFLSGIRPTRKAAKITKSECEKLVVNIKQILSDAIDSGGSTISDFRQAGGSEGYFQHSFQVYGRDGEKCHSCAKVLKNIIIANRASVYCPSCQR